MNLPALVVASAVARPEPVAPPPPENPAPPARGPLDMELPGASSADHFDELRRRAKWHGRRRLATRSLAFAIVLLITVGGLLISQNLHRIFRGDAGTAAALRSNVDPNLLKGEGRGRVNILILGRGGSNHEAPDLTDTIMLASVDPVNHTTTLLSVPRDLWVNVPDLGVMKINAAFESGEFKYLGKDKPGSTDPRVIRAGFKAVDRTVEDVLGIEIDYNVLVDFQAFKQAVDAVGGVKVNVPKKLVDPTMAWENKGNPVLAKAGTRNFNGQKALMYVRSRETSSDYARADRQRAVLLALKSKVETLGTLSNPFKISNLFYAFGNNVTTDLSLHNLSRLYSILKKVSGVNITSVGLDGTGTPDTTRYLTGGNIDGQAIVLPKAGLFRYGAIREFVRSQLKDPYIIKEKAKILVLNGTEVPHFAAKKARELKTYGYNIFETGNTPDPNWTVTTVIDLSHGRYKYTRHYLEQRFKNKAANRLEDTTIPTDGADFVIIIGSNEARHSQN